MYKSSVQIEVKSTRHGQGKVIHYEMLVLSEEWGSTITGYVGFDDHLYIKEVSSLDVQSLVQLSAFLVSHEGWFIREIKDHLDPLRNVIRSINRD